MTPVRGTFRNAGMTTSSAIPRSLTPGPAPTEKSARKASLQVAVWPRLGEQRTRVVDLAPGVPEQHAANAPVAQVVDDALAEGDLPVGDRLQPRIDLSDRLVPEIEEVRIEHRHVPPRDRRAGHRLPGEPPHRVRIVLVLDPRLVFQHHAAETRHVAGSEDVRVARAQPLVDDDAV